MPITLYANGSGGLLERMGATGADVIGLDWTVDMADARSRLGAHQAVQVRCGSVYTFYVVNRRGLYGLCSRLETLTL